MPENENVFDQPAEPAQEAPLRPIRRTIRMQPEPAFRWKFFTGFIGATLILAVPFVFFGGTVLELWKAIGDEVQSGKGMQFLAMFGMFAGVAVICGIFAGMLTRSPGVSFFMGLGLCAVLSVAANAWRASTHSGPDKYPASVRLLEAVFNPAFIKLNRNFETKTKSLTDTEQQLAEQKKATEAAKADAEKSQKALEELQQAMPTKLSEASKTAAEAKVAELQPVLDMRTQEIDALKGKLAATEARVNELVDARKQLDDTVATRVKEVTDLRLKLKETTDKVDALQAKLNAITPVELPNPPKK